MGLVGTPTIVLAKVLARRYELGAAGVVVRFIAILRVALVLVLVVALVLVLVLVIAMIFLQGYSYSNV